MLRKFTFNGVIGLISGLLGLINYLVFIKVEGLAPLGVWSTVSIIIVISQFVEYGLTDGVFRQVALKGNRDEGSKVEFIVTSLIVFLIIGSLLSLLLYFNMDNFFKLTNIDTNKWVGVKQLYVYACICIVLSAFTSCLRAVLYGLDLHSQVNFWMFLCRLMQTSSLMYFIYLGFSYYAQVASLIIYLILMLIGCIYLINKVIFVNFKLMKFKYVSISNVRLLLSSSKEVFIIKTFQKLFIDESFKIILARYVGPEAVGAYATAFNLAQLYRNTVDLGSKVLLNSAIDIQADELIKSLKKIYKFVLSPLSIVAVLLVLAFKYIIQSFEFFSEFTLVYYYLVPLIFAYSINVFATPLYYVLFAKREFKILFEAVLISIFTLYTSFFVLNSMAINNIQYELFTIKVLPYVLMLIISSLFIITSTFKLLNTINIKGIK